MAEITAASTSYVHYDIFISHSGRDKDAGIFATALYSHLHSRGLHVFLDKLEFISEEEVISRIEATISLASVQIPIFSPSYAQWKWCLDALIHMTNSEGTILPVFYKVKPSEVRWTDKDKAGPFALWMRDHEEKERYDLETIQNWRDVLSQVSHISGFELEACNGDEEELLRNEEELLRRVVESVFKVCPHPHYNVFLSHRGPDTKEAFALPLYNRLISRGLRVFLDKPELVEGLRIDPQIEVAIQSASVHITIFSPTFAQSTWCLNELFLMTNSMTKSKHTTFLPVFYKVKPSDLNGVYVEALFSHQKKQRYNSETIQRWRGALADVPNSNDFMLDGNEEVMDKIKEEVMDKIVQRVLEYIPKPQENVQSSEGVVNCVLKENYPKPPENVLRAPVEGYYIGLAEKLEDFEKAVLSQQEEERVEAKVVGILGGGGFGKTTLAKEFFKCKRSNYNESSFLYDVREHAGRLLLTDLQSPDIGIESVEQGIEMLKQHLPSCNALVILDDVDHVDQLDALLPPIKNVLHPKSLILVTSRDKDVLERADIVDSSIYRLEGLNEEQSRELLCHYAFDSRDPLPEFEHLIEEFLRTFDGLPLSLILFGKLLSGKDRCGWEKQLNLLHKCILPVEIEHTLKISYDSFNEEEQLIFLDIACFFIGQDRDTAIRIWGREGLKKLENRCLLKVYSNNKIEMNAHLRNYGRMIAYRLMPRRLWHQPTNQIDDLLEQSPCDLAQCRGITMIHPMQLRGPRNLKFLAAPSHETEMQLRGPRNLKFLAAQGGYVEDILTRVGSPDLIWLSWHKCTYSYLPSWIPMENLRVLEVEGSELTELWQPQSQAPIQLRELNIFAPLSKFPKSIGQLEHLEKIVVKYFDERPHPFTALPEEFCHLRSLKYLELRNCSIMMSLPRSFGELTNLQYIDLKGASSLQVLPNSFGKLTLLKHLCLGECSKITELPGVEHFTCLETLDVRGCKNLESIPVLGQLTKLQTLDVSGCSQIQTLPGLEHLTRLEKFNVRGCQNLQSIPGLGHLTKLQTLDVSGCSEIETMPGLEHLISLEMFNVSGCQKLQSIPGLGSS